MGRIGWVAITAALAWGCSAEPMATNGEPSPVAIQQPSAQQMPAFAMQPGLQPPADQQMQQPPLQQPPAQQPPAQQPPAQQPMVDPTPMAGMDAPMPMDNPMPATDNNTPVMTPPGSKDPVIPPVTADCPTWRSGTISFMGLSGINISAGAKASSPTAPMVFYWHGTGSTAGEYAFMATAVNQGTTSEGGILVSFQGTTGGDGLSGTATFGKGDFDLADQLLACGVQDHNIDPRRIYTTGCSAGGLFATAMAALRSDYIAAAAPNSGGMAFPSGFKTDYTPALMTVHGAPGSDVVIIDFSNSSKTADDIFKNRGGFVINCNHGGGHCGGGGLAGDMWEFFKAHPYGTEPSPWAGGLPSGFNNACKIY